MFHETWASAKPWQKTFWQARSQKKCARQLLELADTAATSNGACLRDLLCLGRKQEIEIIPLGCNFELPDLRPKNYRQLLIFGKAASRAYAIGCHGQLLKQLAQSRLIEEVVLSGESRGSQSDKEIALLKGAGTNFKISTCHNFPHDQVPDKVLDCGLALMCTQSSTLLKSSSFHLAAAAGQVALAVDKGDPGPPLTSGKNFLSYSPQDIQPVIHALQDRDLLCGISENVSGLAASNFNWKAIAWKWFQLLTTH